MKMLSQLLFGKISTTFVKGLTTAVEESLPGTFDNNQHRIFSSADLWNIQRRKRAIVIR